jgi:signal transduction histidine kinase
MDLILNKIEWLVSSLLKLSQLDSRTIELENKKISVKKLINTSIKPLLLLMELKNIKVDIKGDNKIFINGDFNWLSEALGNIIKNSVEHTLMNGQIDIGYNDNPLYTKIVIRDNGEGIDKKDLPFIFNRFYKAKNSHKDSIGIGLALAKTIINSQNGDIKVNSEKGVFTEFIIKIYRSH